MVTSFNLLGLDTSVMSKAEAYWCGIKKGSLIWWRGSQDGQIRVAVSPVPRSFARRDRRRLVRWRSETGGPRGLAGVVTVVGYQEELDFDSPKPEQGTKGKV